MRSSNRRRYCISKHRHHSEESQTERDDEDFSELNSQSASYSLQQQSNTNTNTNNVEKGDGDGDGDENYSASSYLSSSCSSISTYVNVAPLPVFHGDSLSECPLAHISRFLTVCRANNALSSSAIRRIFPVTLLSSASLWYDLYVHDTNLTWPEIRSSFIDFFLRPDSADTTRSTLLHLRQSEDEPVNRYHLRMQGILKRWPDNGLPEELLKGVFVDGLREDFRDWIILQRPETLEEAVGLARDWERVAARKKREAAIRELIRCGFCEGEGHGEEECQVRRRVKELWLKNNNSDPVKKEMMGDPMMKKGFGRSVSTSAVLGGGGQCQCWKHQCWRKKLERSASTVASLGEKKDVANIHDDE